MSLLNLARSDAHLHDWSLLCLLTSDSLDTFITGIIFFQLLLELNPLWFRCNQAEGAYFMHKQIMFKTEHQINFLLFHLSLSGSGLKNKQMETRKWLTSLFEVEKWGLNKGVYVASLELGERTGCVCWVFCFNWSQSMHIHDVYCTSVLVVFRSVIPRTASNSCSV